MKTYHYLILTSMLGWVAYFSITATSGVGKITTVLGIVAGGSALSAQVVRED